VHAREHDDIDVDLGRLAREQEAVADDIGDAMEDFRRLVIVSQHHGVAAALQLQDRVDVLGECSPFERRDDAFDALIERRGPGEKIGIEQGHLYSP
jgi:hypothetical protein